jgi:hypothetical protein
MFKFELLKCAINYINLLRHRIELIVINVIRHRQTGNKNESRSFMIFIKLMPSVKIEKYLKLDSLTW